MIETKTFLNQYEGAYPVLVQEPGKPVWFLVDSWLRIVDTNSGCAAWGLILTFDHCSAYEVLDWFEPEKPKIRDIITFRLSGPPQHQMLTPEQAKDFTAVDEMNRIIKKIGEQKFFPCSVSDEEGCGLDDPYEENDDLLDALRYAGPQIVPFQKYTPCEVEERYPAKDCTCETLLNGHWNGCPMKGE